MSSVSPKGSKLSSEQKARQEFLIGIDFGETHSSVGIFQNGKAEIIANDQGQYSTPSVVSVLQSGEALVGDSAVAKAASNRKNTLFGLKNLLGRVYDDEETQALLATLPYTCEPDTSMNPPEISVVLEVGEPTPRPVAVPVPELVAHVLKALRQAAEAYAGLRVTAAALAHPPDWPEAAAQALARAARRAGLKEVDLVPAPCAVAVAHRLDDPSGEEGGGGGAAGSGLDRDRAAVVVDWGGGGVAATVLGLQGGVLSARAHRRRRGCGGAALAGRLARFAAQDFQRRYKMDVFESRKAVTKLTRACEQTLNILSISNQTALEVDSLMDGLDLRLPVSRARFEDLVGDLLPEGVMCINEALAEIELVPASIDLVLLSGGVTSMPRVQNIIQHMFPQSRILQAPGKPEEVVALGATWQAFHLSNQHPDTEIGEEFPVLPESVGILNAEGGFIPVLTKGCFLPASADLVIACTQPSEAEGTSVAYQIQVCEGEELKTPLGVIILRQSKSQAGTDSEEKAVLHFSLGLTSGLEVTAHFASPSASADESQPKEKIHIHHS